MDFIKRQALLKKREILKIKLDFDNFARDFISPIIEITSVLREINIEILAVSFRYIPKQFLTLLNDYLINNDYKKLNIPIKNISENDVVMEKVIALYNNENPVRYVPNLPVYTTLEIEKCLMKKKEDYKTVQIAWFSYGFILEINSENLEHILHEEIINPYLGDFIIFPEDYHWLAAYSLEEEWRFGELQNRIV